MSENFTAFRIAARDVFELEPGPEGERQLEIVCVQGGPVFLFYGRISAADALKAVESNPPGFDLSASGTAKAARGLGRSGVATLFNYSDANVALGHVLTR